MNATLKKAVGVCAIAALAMSVVAGCGPEPQQSDPKRLRVSLFGWGPGDDGADTFVSGMPAYQDAAVVSVRVTEPGAGRILEEVNGEISERSVRIPDVPFGTGLRLEMDILNGAGEVLASGATPQFDFDETQSSRELRMMVMPLNSFAPAGSVVTGQDNQQAFIQSRMDYRSAFELSGGATDIWLGRVGHAAVPTSDGKVLVVGGANVTPGTAPGAIPKFDNVYSDLQIFDPRTGYFTDLSYDEASDQVRPDGADRLVDARAFHTVTPIGNDRFIVSGGYNTLVDVTRPVRSLELIDLNAEPGQRVQPVTDSTGVNPLQTLAPRGFHESVYLEDSGLLLMIGGIGEGSEDIMGDIEVIDIANQRVLDQRFPLNTARTDHQAVPLADGSIWIIGGRNNDAVLGSTEIVTPNGGGFDITPGPALKQARYAFSAAKISQGDGTRVVVLGGFTSLDGEPTATYEVGVKGLESFVSGPTWAFGMARGGLQALVLPQTQDILLFGGRDASNNTIGSVERLQFLGLDEPNPYQLLAADIGSFVVDRRDATFSLMTSGQVLVVGGEGKVRDVFVALDSAELYNPRDPIVP